TLPVVLSSFTATVVSDSKVRINWTTQSETGVQGFYVLRCEANDLDLAEIVSPLVDATNTSTSTSYVFTDNSVPHPGEYYYWLQMQDIDGVATFTNSIKVAVAVIGGETPEVILVTALKNAYPNPFNPAITISFDIAEPGPVSLDIYNAKGQRVRTLVSETKESASYKVIWDGKDAGGRTVATGSYLVKMKAPGFNTIKKITLMK
ncbi:MAG: FlgD immunoglobulin-like domain containing protein, partial [Candidatus Cloacimonadales bacterium]|nr:T9SS type A sorting domain-containing protein [Candidatus Cloacimonadota bacterium]